MSEESKEEKEFLEEPNVVLSKRVTQEDVNDSINIYVGEENLKVLRNITKKEYELLQSLNLNSTSSYFVKGSRNQLKMFKAFFIAKCAYERYSYAECQLKEYIEGLQDREDDFSFLTGVERELLFLYLHKESSGIGNTDNWLATTALDKITSRNRKGLITVLLSERDFPIVEESDEVKVIDMGGAVMSKNASIIASKIATKVSTSSSTTTACYD